VIPMRVTFEDGRTEIVCCGPRVIALDGVFGYVPQYEHETSRRVCCHAGPIRAGLIRRLHREALDTDALYEALGAKFGRAAR